MSRITIEDIGPALEAIAAKAHGEAWRTMNSFNKQRLARFLVCPRTAQRRETLLAPSLWQPAGVWHE